MRSALVTLMALVLSTVGFGPLGRAPEAAAAPHQLVRIELLQVTPDTLTATGTVTIKGRVTNTSGKPMRYVSVAMWRDYYPIVASSDLQWTLNSPPEAPEGYRMTSPESSFVNLSTDPHPTFAAGQSAEFTLSAPVQDLRLIDTAPGRAYLLGVHVRAFPAGQGNQTVGRSRVLMPWDPTAPGSTVQARLAPIVLLASAPALALDGTFTDDHLAGELTGRLHTLLRAAELPGATPVLDPALYDEVAAMADGYTVGDVDVPAEDPRARSAADWLARVNTLLRAGRVYRTPYGNADVATAAALNRTGALDWAAQALPSTHPLARVPLAVWPAYGRTLARQDVERLQALTPQLWVQPGSGSVERFRDQVFVTHDVEAASGGPGPEPSTTVPQRRARLLTQLVVERRPVILAVTRADEAASLLGLPTWVHTVPLPPATTATSLPLITRSSAPADKPLLWSEVLATRQRLNRWLDLSGTQDVTAVDVAQVASRAQNPGLNQSQGLAWLQRASASVPDHLESDVVIALADSFVVGENNAMLPMTVTNRSTHPIRVKVRLLSDHPARIDIPETDLVTIAPGQSISLRFRPRATTNGVVGFTAQAVTAGGRPVGQPTRFSINATSFGRVGWIIIIASGVIVLGGTALRIRQVQGSRRAARAVAPDGGGGEPGTSEPRVDTTSRPHP